MRTIIVVIILSFFCKLFHLPKFIKHRRIQYVSAISSVESFNQSVLHGLELMDDKRAMMIEKIKNVIIEMVHYADELPKINFSDSLSEKLNYDYTYLSNLFSETEGTTIEHFILLHKIERVK